MPIKKIYNWVTEIKINKKVANRASWNIKNIHCLVNTDTVNSFDKKTSPLLLAG